MRFWLDPLSKVGIWDCLARESFLVDDLAWAKILWIPINQLRYRETRWDVDPSFGPQDWHRDCMDHVVWSNLRTAYELRQGKTLLQNFVPGTQSQSRYYINHVVERSALLLGSELHFPVSTSRILSVLDLKQASAYHTASTKVLGPAWYNKLEWPNCGKSVKISSDLKLAYWPIAVFSKMLVTITFKATLNC